jgi:hypothetical protein
MTELPDVAEVTNVTDLPDWPSWRTLIPGAARAASSTWISPPPSLSDHNGPRRPRSTEANVRVAPDSTFLRIVTASIRY